MLLQKTKTPSVVGNNKKIVHDLGDSYNFVYFLFPLWEFSHALKNDPDENRFVLENSGNLISFHGESNYDGYLVCVAHVRVTTRACS